MDLVDIYNFGNRIFTNFKTFLDWLRTPIGDVPSFKVFWKVLDLGLRTDDAFFSMTILEILFGAGIIVLCVLSLVRFVIHIVK